MGGGSIAGTAVAAVLMVQTVTAAEPVILSVLHGARMSPPGLSGAGLVPGAVALISGANLGGRPLEALPPYETSLGGTSVRITPAGSQGMDAPVLAASSGRVKVLVPAGFPPGAASITVTYQGQTSGPVSVTVVASNFGIFTRNGEGYGPAVAFAGDPAVPGAQPVGLSTPARAGQMVTLRGTGLGSGGGEVTVLVGSRTVAAESAGGMPDLPGTDEVRFRLPEGDAVPDGCYVPVAVRTGEAWSNFATLAKSRDGACAHPMGLPEAVLQNLDAGKPARLGIFGLVSITVTTPTDAMLVSAVGGTFGAFGAGAVFLPGGFAPTIAPGTCTVFHSGARRLNNRALFPVPLGRGLDAGFELTLTDPAGREYGLSATERNAYEEFFLGAPPPGAGSFIGAGTWGVAGDGGDDVAPFTAELDVAAPILWTNKDAIARIDRTQDLTVTWKATGEESGGAVVSGAVVTSGQTDILVSQFACVAPMSGGTLTVPAAILSQLPGTGAPGESFGALVLSNEPFSAGRRFPADLTAGESVDAALFTYLLGDGKLLDVR